jgi:hypothetical protein
LNHDVDRNHGKRPTQTYPRITHAPVGGSTFRFTRIPRRWLVSGRTLGIPDTAFSGRGVRPLRNIQRYVSMLVKVRVLAAASTHYPGRTAV